MSNLPIPVALHIALMISMVVFGLFGIIAVRAHKTGWFKRHRLVMFCGVAAGVLGILVMAVFKMLKGYGHFKSEHAEHGLIAILAMITVLLCGQFLIKKFKFLKWPHRIAGYIAWLLCIYAAYLGFSMVLG